MSVIRFGFGALAILLIALSNSSCADQTARGLPGRSTAEVTNAAVVRILVKPKPDAIPAAAEAA